MVFFKLGFFLITVLSKSLKNFFFSLCYPYLKWSVISLNSSCIISFICFSLDYSTSLLFLFLSLMKEGSSRRKSTKRRALVFWAMDLFWNSGIACSCFTIFPWICFVEWFKDHWESLNILRSGLSWISV